jgi:starch-binding outer membrane protein, SusD/RagB family
MKTKFIYKIAVLMVVVSSFAACSKDFLEEIPRLSSSNELSLSTYEGLQNATVGAYSLLCSSNWYGAGFVITADLKGGNAKRGPLNSGRYVNEYLWNNNASATSLLWDDAYSTIARANNVINAINAGFTEPSVTRAQLNQLEGECLFIRALAHWDLVRLYAQPYAAGTGNMGIPIVLVTENGYPARNTVGDVYTRVLADLDSAKALLPVVNTRGNDGAWATKRAATALQAKVYLYMGQWQKAANLATEVIGQIDANFKMFTALKYTTWNSGGYWGSGGAGSEIIFQVDGSQGNSDSGFWEAISYMVSPVGYGDIATSHDLLNLYEAGDVRANLFANPAAWPTEYWTLKYPGRLGSNPAIDFNVPVLRLAEMYLIRAEALLNGATIGGATALGDYNTIRTNRGLTAAGTVTLADIYKERRRELCFEGNELFDLARTQRSLTRVDFTGSLRKDVPFVVGGTPVQNYLWAMPIPQGEKDANINMVQNPEY